MFVSYMMMTKRKNDQCIYLGYGHTIIIMWVVSEYFFIL